MTHNDNKSYGPGSYVIVGKALDRYFELNSLHFEFHKLFNSDVTNDRAIAIVGAAFLDTLLGHILWAFFIDDDEEVKELLRADQPVGAFSSRIRLTYCLGLICKPVRDDLDYVRRIRNKFAHTLDISFEDQQIKGWCQNLKWHRIAFCG